MRNKREPHRPAKRLPTSIIRPTASPPNEEESQFSDGTQVSYTYDGNGNLTSRTDATGTATYVYDRQNRLTSETRPGGTTTHTYDSAGNMTSSTDPGGTVNYTFGPTNLLSALTEPDSAQTRFDYDAEGRRTRTTYPNGVKVERGYDDADRIANITNRAASGTVLKQYQYTHVAPGGRETALRQTVTDQSGNETTYAYDALDRLTAATARNSGGTVIDAYGYAYDNASNRTSVTRNGTTVNSTYNDANQLTANGTTSYVYDGAGTLCV